MKRTRHIGDFCSWKDHDTYQKSFDEEDAFEDAPPVADERVAFFLVVAMSFSVAESSDERWGWNR